MGDGRRGRDVGEERQLGLRGPEGDGVISTVKGAAEVSDGGPGGVC